IDIDKNQFYSKGTVAGVNYKWGHCVNITADFAKELTVIPFSLQVYSVSKSMVNTNSMVLNSANPHALADVKNVNEIYDITTFQGAITDIGQMTNNRQGVNLKHENTYGKLKVMAAIGLSKEIENLYDTISFWHKANSLNRSKFGYFLARQGPYGRITNMFRRSWEKIAITDAVSDYEKGFSSLDLSLKYKFSLFGKGLIVANYNNYNSAQEGFSIPQFSDKAFLRTFYEEFMMFYSLLPKWTVIGFASYEKNLGNMRTQLADPSTGNVTTDATVGKPINQTGYGYGVGVDFDITPKAGLYLRQRWFSHQDKNFIKDKFKGYETTLEFKVFF
ncbi:MAG: hypothetical protein K2X86_12380, partial [Cytophagaceae bacterium]|nr:hypothetical protein [Cytophagaceae bacterium]